MRAVQRLVIPIIAICVCLGAGSCEGSFDLVKPVRGEGDPALGAAGEGTDPDRAFSAQEAASGLLISEICIHNRTLMYDNNGKYGTPYLEIRNFSDQPCFPEGWGITTDPEEPCRYRFPSGMKLDPGQAYLLWGKENEDAEGCYREGYTPPVLGFSFAEGDSLYLWDADGTLLQQVDIPAMEEDRSIAFDPVENRWSSVGQPTPGRAEEAAKGALLYGRPVFSAAQGFYEKPFFLEIVNPNGRGKVHYTLDGSVPDGDSPVLAEGERLLIEDRSPQADIYSVIPGTSAIEENIHIPEEPVDKATVVRALVMDDEGGKSPMACGVYFVGFGRKEGYQGMPVLSLVADPEELFSPERGVYVTGKVYENYQEKYAVFQDELHRVEANYNGEGRGWERQARAVFFNEERKPEYEGLLGIRMHGNYSVSAAQKGFNLYAREEYDGREAFPESLIGLKEDTLALRSADGVCTKIRDALNERLVMGREVSAQRSRPCILFLNGEYWGLYQLQERVGESYLEAHYGLDQDNVVILKNGEVIRGAKEDKSLYAEMTDYALNHDLSRPEHFSRLEELLDMQSFIEYYCTEIYLANADAFQNNYACFRVRRPTEDTGHGDGKWRFMLYDTDSSAGKHAHLSSYAVDSFREGNYYVNLLEEPLFSALLKNEGFKERFKRTFREMAEKDFAYARVQEELSHFGEEYKAAAVKSGQRFSADYSGEKYDEELKVIDEFFRHRKEYIIRYLEEDLQ